MIKQIKKIIRNSIDLHLHIGPEIIPRKYNQIEAIIKQENNMIAGFALKNHFYSTLPLIKALRNTGQLKLIGGIVLNNFNGGLNEEAVYAASLIADMPFIVWMPTINAQNFLNKTKFEIPSEWVKKQGFSARKSKNIAGISVLDKDSKVNKKAIGALRAIKKAKAILATGHLSWQETKSLVKTAKGVNINKIIITHPIYQKISMPIHEQIKLANLGCYIEICYSMYSIDKIPITKIIEQINKIGADNIILTSDVGQQFSPNPSKALEIFAATLFSGGISLNSLEKMLVNNPRTLVE